MLKIGILCAIDEEHAALCQAFGINAGNAAPGPFWLASVESASSRIHLAQSGIGKASVAALTAYMFARHPDIDLLAFSGVAGGLNPALSPGAMVIASETATHDYGARRQNRLDWFPAGSVPIGPSPPLAYEAASLVTPALQGAMKRLQATGATVCLGRVISGDVFLNCRETRDALQAGWNAEAIDMESAAFAETARRFGKPIVALRTISDRACEESHITFEQTARTAAENSAQFMAAYVQALEADPISRAMIRAAAPKDQSQAEPV